MISRVRVGGRPVHIYSINQTSSIWSHSDAEGSFYVIPMNSTTNVSAATVVKVIFYFRSTNVFYHVFQSLKWEIYHHDHISSESWWSSPAGMGVRYYQQHCRLWYLVYCSSLNLSTGVGARQQFGINGIQNRYSIIMWLHWLWLLQSYTNVPAHGKLIVNNALYPIAYGELHLEVLSTFINVKQGRHRTASTKSSGLGFLIELSESPCYTDFCL